MNIEKSKKVPKYLNKEVGPMSDVNDIKYKVICKISTTSQMYITNNVKNFYPWFWIIYQILFAYNNKYISIDHFEG